MSEWIQKLEKRKRTPEVWEAVGAHHGSKAKCVGSINDRRDPKEHTNVGDDDLVGLVGSEDDRLGGKVVGEAGIRALTSGIPDEIHGPTEEL